MRTNIHYDTEDLWKKDSDFLIHAWHDFEHMPRSLVITDSEGCYIYDSEGRKYLDAPAGMWCIQVGYGREEIVDAVADQMRRLVYFSPFHQMTSPTTAELGAKLASLAPGDLNKVFLSGSGSDANEAAVRFALFYHNFRGNKTKRQLISRIDSYHGSTYLTGSLTGKMSERSPEQVPEARTEEIAEDVAEVGERLRVKAGGGASGLAETIVVRPLLAVPEHRVCLGRLLEALGRLGIIRVSVWVPADRRLAISPLDLLLAGIPGHREDLVVICAHGTPGVPRLR